MTTREQQVKSKIDRAMKASIGLSLDKFASALVKDFKGEEGLAHEFHDTYSHADAGSNTRRAILEGVMKLLIVVGQGQSELDKLDKEDLEAEAMALLAGDEDAGQSGNGQLDAELGG